MCGRYTVLTEDEIIEIREILKDISLRLVRDDPASENYNAANEVLPTNRAPVIAKQGDGIAFESVKWGFKNRAGSGVIINARSETLRQKGMFSGCLETGRCVIPAAEFFEWNKRADGKKKYYAKDRAGNLLFMAGLYRDSRDANAPGGLVREFVIITKKATGEMARIHDRIPVILRVNQIEDWLTGIIRPEDVENMDYDVEVRPCDGEDVPEQLSLF